MEEAIEVLQQLGLKEYEARCFVGLSRSETGTAKKLSEVTEVPRTRIYDSIRILEAQGLVEVQHSSPQQFRAVSVDEAIQTLRDQYETRVECLQNVLETIQPVNEGDKEPVQEVWTMSGQAGIENRTEELIRTATEEIVLIIGDESPLTESLVTTLNDVGNGVEVVIGAVTEPLQEQIQTAVPDATTFTSGLEWLRGENATEDETAIGRLVLIDRSTILVSSIMPQSKAEEAIFCEGFGNSFVVIARRLISHGLLSDRAPII